MVKRWRLLSDWVDPSGAQKCKHHLMKRRRQRRSWQCFMFFGTDEWVKPKYIKLPQEEIEGNLWDGWMYSGVCLILCLNEDKSKSCLKKYHLLENYTVKASSPYLCFVP